MKKSSPGSRQRGQVLIILFLGTLLLGGAGMGLNAVFGEQSLKSIRKELKVLVPDGERRRQLDGILKRMGAAGDRFASDHKRHGTDLLLVMSRHEATPADVDRLVQEADSTNRELRRTLLDLRDELRSSVSAEEWRMLFRPGVRETGS